MADLTVVAANVKPAASTVTKKGIAGESISAGESVFKAADGGIELCENDQAALDAACIGVALNDAAVDQPIEYAITGDVNMGAIMTIGQTYVVGAAPGGIAPEVDVIATEFLTVIGVATTTSNLKLGILQSGVAHG
ncbi:hypothetical protein LCGC14_2490120 [marine sediment metagenome]|uniref:Uncharacterized protein n=1 Tax=marine sediment metagenome TaxID=412755 RepID=A0A0F9B5N2_9ZZZZ